MGIYCFHQIDLVREYIQIELTDHIVASVRYLVSFHVSLAENQRYAVSTLGAYFSVDAISRDDYYRFEVEPQVLNKPLTVLTDTANWVLITDTFNSRYGGERYLTIGNFHTDVDSDTLLYNTDAPLGHLGSYYYIDDVSVVAIDSIPSGVEENRELRFSVHPNPTNGPLTITSTQPLLSIAVLDMLGRVLLSERGNSSNTKAVDLSHLPAGIYVVQVETEAGRWAQRVVRE